MLASSRNLQHTLPPHHQRAGIGAGAIGKLGHRDRLATEHGFVTGQLMGLQQQAIGRHAIALGQQQDIAAHHLRRRDTLRLAISDHQRTRAGQIAQRLQHTLGAALLQQGDGHDDDHEAEQDQRLPAVAHHQVEAAGGQQEDKHRLAQQLAKQHRPAAGRFLLPLIAAFGGQARRGFSLAQATGKLLRHSNSSSKA